MYYVYSLIHKSTSRRVTESGNGCDVRAGKLTV